MPARHFSAALVASLTLALAACGGGDDNDDDSGGGNVPVAQHAGDLVGAQQINQISAAEILAALTAPDSKVQDGVTPLYAVNSYRLTYLTTDKDGAQTTASGLISVPVKPSGARLAGIRRDYAGAGFCGLGGWLCCRGIAG